MQNPNIVPVNLKSIQLHRPLPFNLVDRNGILLASKGFVFGTEKLLMDLANHGGGFYVDFSRGGDRSLNEARKSYVNRLFTAMREQVPLGDIASVAITYASEREDESARSVPADWENVIELSNTLLQVSNADNFDAQLGKVIGIVNDQIHAHPDDTLLALFYLASTMTHRYSATHSLLVAAVCGITAQSVLHWPASEVDLLMRAALTMNVGMTALQDVLARQPRPPDAEQQEAIAAHAEQSSTVLRNLGVSDPLWLDITRTHHERIAQPLQAPLKRDRFVGLIQRADVFTARLSPRATRKSSTKGEAMRTIYFSDKAQTDAAGAALIKAVGIYHPGSFVRLSNGDTAIVIRRGVNTASPVVASVMNRDGLLITELTVRDTAKAPVTIEAPVEPGDVRINLSLERLLRLNHL